MLSYLDHYVVLRYLYPNVFLMYFAIFLRCLDMMYYICNSSTGMCFSCILMYFFAILTIVYFYVFLLQDAFSYLDSSHLSLNQSPAHRTPGSVLSCWHGFVMLTRLPCWHGWRVWKQTPIYIFYVLPCWHGFVMRDTVFAMLAGMACLDVNTHNYLKLFHDATIRKRLEI